MNGIAKIHAWLNMMLLLAVEAEIAVREGDRPLDLLQNMQTFLWDKLTVSHGKASRPVSNARRRLARLVAKARKRTR